MKVQMASKLLLTIAASLPFVGVQTATFPINVAGVAETAVDDVLKLDGGKVDVNVKVTKITEGSYKAALSVNVPEIGEVGTNFTINAEGAEEKVIDELLALDGGTISGDVTVTEAV